MSYKKKDAKENMISTKSNRKDNKKRQLLANKE